MPHDFLQAKWFYFAIPSQLTESTVGSPGLLYTHTEEIVVQNEFHWPLAEGPLLPLSWVRERTQWSRYTWLGNCSSICYQNALY